MSARTLRYSAGILSIFREVFYTLAQLGEEPLAAPHIPAFEKAREDLKDILLQELSHLEQLEKAQAAVDRADAKLDRFAARVINVVEDTTDGNTKKQLRKKLLKGKSLSKFRRPTLGRQLADMADWSQTLATCGVAALGALAPEADSLYQLGKSAAAVRDKAQADNRNFRDVGARKQIIDTLNAERKSTSGALAKLPFQNPALPQDFADGFFSSEPPRDEEETIDDVRESVAALKTQLAEEQERLAAMEREEEAAAKEEQEAKEREAQAEALEKEAAVLLAKAADLKKK